jgi:hypothetical protein
VVSFSSRILRHIKYVFFADTCPSPTVVYGPPGTGAHQVNGGEAPSPNLPPPEIARNIPCKFFLLGTCRYGNACLFSHDFMPAPPPGHVPGPDPVMGMYYAPPPMPHDAGGQDMSYPPYAHQAYYAYAPPPPQPYVYPQAQMQYPGDQGQPASTGSAAAPPQSAPQDYRHPQAMVASPTSPTAGLQPMPVMPQHLGFSPYTQSFVPLMHPIVPEQQHQQSVDDGQQRRASTASAHSPTSPAHHDHAPSLHTFFQTSAGDSVPPPPTTNVARPQMPPPMAAGPPHTGPLGGPRRPGHPGTSPAPYSRGGHNKPPRPRYSSADDSNQNGGQRGTRPPCSFFAENRCRYGDECSFRHQMPDGSDARLLQQGLIGVDGLTARDVPYKPARRPSNEPRGRIGMRRDDEARERVERLIDSTRSASHPKSRPSTGPAQQQPGRVSPNSRPAFAVAAHLQQSAAYAASRSQRIPAGEADFPALPVQATSPTVGSTKAASSGDEAETVKATVPIVESPAEEEKATAAVETSAPAAVVNDSAETTTTKAEPAEASPEESKRRASPSPARLVSSFASAAARGAAAPAPAPRKSAVAPQPQPAATTPATDSAATTSTKSGKGDLSSSSTPPQGARSPQSSLQDVRGTPAVAAVGA